MKTECKRMSFIVIKKLKKRSVFLCIFDKEGRGFVTCSGRWFPFIVMSPFIIKNVKSFRFSIMDKKITFFLTLAISKQSFNYIRKNWGSKGLAQMYEGFVKQWDYS